MSEDNLLKISEIVDLVFFSLEPKEHGRGVKMKAPTHFF